MNKKLFLLFILLASAVGLRAQGSVSFADAADGMVTLNQGSNINSNYAYSGTSSGNSYSGASDMFKIQFGTSDPDWGTGSNAYPSKWVIEAYDGASWWVISYNNNLSSPAPPTAGWTDATGGFDAVSNFTVTLPGITATTSQTNVSCNGMSNGTATVAPSGGTAPYTYSWSPSGGTGATATGLAANTYTVTITDAASNFITKTFIITQPNAIVVSPVSQTNVACNGSFTGSASVTVSGGTGPYTYSWAPSGGTAATATGLAAGTYTVTVTDANSCTATRSFTISQPTAISTSGSQTNVSCNGGSNGTATVIASGGTPAYTYSWAPSGGTAATATGLSAGTYTVTITDANNCTATKSFTIIQPTAISISGSQTNVSCNGGSNGTATVIASGGTPAYTYSWAPSGGTAATATGLAVGTYTATTTDANGCTASKSFTITQPTAITASTSETDVTTYGGTNGTATVTASGGTSGYTYSWSPSGGTGATATGLAAGNYSVTVTDANSCQVVRSVTVSQPAPLPIITIDAGSATFVAGDNVTSTPVAIDAGVTVTDPGSAILASATVAITGNFSSGEDVLYFTNDGSTMGNVSGSYNATTGVLTLTSSGATATLAQWQSALRSITYTNTVVSPNTATRTISFTVVDGAANTSATTTRTVTVTNTDQTPIVTATSGTTNYVGATSAVTIDGGVFISDHDNSTQASGTVSISGGFHSGDVLSFTNNGSTMGNITGSYNAGTGVLTLTSAGATSTIAQWQSALRAITFSTTSTTYGNRTISFTVSDGTKTSIAATDVMNVTQPPVVSTSSGSASFVAGDNTASTPVPIDAGITVTDGSATSLASATVAITGGFHSGEDVLGFINDGSTMGNINTSFNAATGVLMLTSSGATATLAQWQSALGSITYTNSAVSPNTPTRTISFSAIDGAANTSNTATRTVTVTATDQTPIVTTTGSTTNYVGGTSAVTIDGGISVTDADNTTQSTATVSITSDFHPGDTETFINTNSTTFGNIIGSYNAATGVLTLTSSGAIATNAQWSNALSAVTFSASSAAIPGSRTISFAVNDAIKTSAGVTDILALLGPPTLSTSGGSTPFVEGDNTAAIPVKVDAGITLTDGNASTLATATIAITGNFNSGEDVLSFTNSSATTYGNIAGSYNSAVGVLTLSSAGNVATLAQWQSALQTVSYTNTAIMPNTAMRTISFTAIDAGAITSNTATKIVAVTATDQTPIVTTTNSTVNYVLSAAATIIDNGISVSDLDNTTQSSAAVSISAGFSSGDGLTFINTSSALFGNIVGSFNTATGVLTLVSSGATATDVQWAKAMSAVTFSSSSTNTANRAISFTVNDGTKTSTAATDVVSVAKPTLTITANDANITYGGTASAFSVTYNGFVNGDDASSALTTQPTISTTATSSSPVGAYSIAASGAVAANYTIVYVPGTLTVTPAALTIIAGDQSKVYGSTIPTLTASYSGLVNGDTEASLSTQPILTTSATSGSPIGNYTITVSGATDANYSISYTAGNLAITPAAITVTTDAQSKNYGDADPALTYQITSGSLVGSDSFTGSLTRDAGENAGSYAIRQGTLALSSNYNLTFAGANLTIGARAITITADAQSKNYGDADPALTYQITSGSLVGSDSFTGSLTRDAGENAGSYLVRQGTLALSSNYNLTFAGANLAIGARGITITADAQSKNYGDADPALTYQITSGSLVTGDSFTGSLTRDAGENAGSYAIRQGTLALNNNYNLTFAGANLAVGARGITITADAQSKNYGEADPALTYQITSGSLVTGDSFTGSLTRDAGENAGSYAIRQGTLALNNNYNLTFAGANLAIGARGITITADAQSKNYGDADPALTYQITSGSLVTGDSFTGSLTRDAGENAGSYVVRQGTLALSSNYNLTFAGSNLTIGTRAITITADAQSKNYGAVDPALTYQITSGSLVGSDAFTGSLTRDAGENVGTYAIRKATLALNNNYTLTFAGANLTINKAALSIAANSLTRAYGQANPTLTMAYTGFVNGDDASKLTAQPVIITTAANNSATGTYPITVNGAASPNYNISYVPGTLTVTAATLTITADDQIRVYGSANPVLTAHYSGFINGDDATRLTTVPSLGTAASASSTAGDYTITASGAAMPNYNIVYQPGTLTISKARLTVTANDQRRAFGAANPQLTISYTGFVNGDDVSKLSTAATASTIAGANTAPGTYPINVTGAASANYTFTYVPGTLTIAPLTDDNLSSLVVNQGRVVLSPDFSPAVYSYSATVENQVNQVNITALFAPTGTGQINGGVLYNNNPSNDILLNTGSNSINVTITAQNGSQHTYIISIYRGLPASSITATNILTPNGDGKNDTWFVKDINLYPNNTVSVYDRAGRLVYNKHEYQNDWDGTLKGAPLGQGTYYFTIDLGNGGNEIRGFITIIRE